MNESTNEELVSDQQVESNGTFSFQKTKKLGTLTLNRVESGVKVSDEKIVVESITKHLGFIKGKVKTHYINLKDIQSIDIKKKLSIYYLIFALLFVTFGIVSNPLYLIVALLSLWIGLSTNVAIKSTVGKGLLIQSDTKEEAEQFIEYINQKL